MSEKEQARFLKIQQKLVPAARPFVLLLLRAALTWQ